MPNETRYLGFRHTTGDASRAPWVGAILVPTGARDLHFASAADENTDWNVANPTHPTISVHSETTPATDYVAMSHDGDNFTLQSFGGGLILQTPDGETTTIPDDRLLAFGTGDDIRFSWDTTDANANELLLQMPAGGAVNVPVLVIGQSIESVDLGLYNGVVNPRVAMFGVGAVTTGPVIEFRKARGTVASPTVVTSGDDLGTLDFYGAVAAGEYVRAASIRADMTGTIATTRGPGNLSFNVATDEAPSSLTERLLITGSGAITLTSATNLNLTVVGGNDIRFSTIDTLRLTVGSTGLVTFAAGSTPGSVGTTPGTAGGGGITATGGVGGATTIATTGVGGLGAGFSFTGGAGGTANSATTAATGGAGGAWTVTTGAGAATAVAGTTSTGGAGGAITLTTGVGGAVSLAVSGTATGGAAGLLTIQGGVGGAVTATTGTNVGGAGGGISVIAGAGGAASGATDTGGAGGIITITPGAGGTGDANAAGKAGFINITTSYIRRSVQTLDMADAAVTLTVVPGTPVGTTMTSDVLYVDANSGTTENLLLPPEADLTGIILVIVNTGGETINIQNDAGGAVLTLETANTAFVTCDGTTLRGVVGIP